MRFHAHLIICGIMLICVFQHAYAQSTPEDTILISRTDLQEDIRQCRKHYENNFANLYHAHTKIYVDSVFDALEASVQPMTAIQFFNYMSAITQCIADGHVYILPPADWSAGMDTAGKFFPLRMMYRDGAFFTEIDLRLNQTGVSLVDKAITEINGVASATIHDRILQILPVEQRNTQYPEWIFERYFFEYYSYVFGHPDTFILTIADYPEPVIIPAARKEDMFDVRMQFYQSVPYYATRDKGMVFEFLNESTALLSIYTWDIEAMKKTYRLRFKREIDTYMAALTSEPIEPTDQLIIDLRDNQGGSFVNSIHLMRWLMDTSFNYIKEIRRVRKIPIGEERTRSVSVRKYQDIKPFKQAYTGKIIILTNGGSFSNSGIFCALMQYYGRAIIVGEETGGRANYLSGSFGMNREVTLKHSKLRLSATNHSIQVLSGGPESGAGVQPDIPIQDSWNAYTGDGILRQLLQK